jgi:antibiotic biosynthesis monooxygenase (ABM) superfamily enzyme
VRGVILAARTFPDYAGGEVLSPTTKRGAWQLILHFDTQVHLEESLESRPSAVFRWLVSGDFAIRTEHQPEVSSLDIPLRKRTRAALMLLKDKSFMLKSVANQ